MRSKTLFVLTAAALLGLLRPAGLDGQILMLGVKGGVNVADVSITDDTGFDEITESVGGFVGGAFLQFGGGLLGLRAEALYSQRGFGQTDTGGNAELGADYLEIPVLLVVRFSQSPVRPLVFAGPVASFETGCEVTGAVGQVSASVDCLAADVETESAEFGVAIGGGVELDVGTFTLLFDGRYNLGLTNLDATEETEALNRTWSFMAGLGFGIG